MSTQKAHRRNDVRVVTSLLDLAQDGFKAGTIYADPPWKYSNQSTRAATGRHYVTMSVDEICAEPVRSIVLDNAHLHIWTTNAFLFDCRRVIEAWGFTYKSCLVWCKPQMGIGNYWRVSHEFLLLGVRGRTPFGRRDCMSWFVESRTQHSHKPDTVRKLIEDISPEPRLEMYGREAIPSWTVYGNEVEKTLFS